MVVALGLAIVGEPGAYDVGVGLAIIRAGSPASLRIELVAHRAAIAHSDDGAAFSGALVVDGVGANAELARFAQLKGRFFRISSAGIHGAVVGEDIAEEGRLVDRELLALGGVGFDLAAGAQRDLDRGAVRVDMSEQARGHPEFLVGR